jgi:glutathione S-transferase
MPHVALLESGLSFVAVRVDEASKKMADGGDYRAINPLGYIPALVLDDGSVLLEAAAIAQFIADRDPTSIADVGLYAMTGWTPRFDIRAYPNLVAHHARIASRDAVREVHRIEGPVPA